MENFIMKEATNKEEAVISILDVMKENPLWLNKCQSYIARTIISFETNVYKKTFLNMLSSSAVTDLFIELKTEYYNFKDNTVWS
jgi:hypothetical protein